MTFEYHKQSMLKELQRFKNVHFRSLSPQEADEIGVINRAYSPETINCVETELSRIKFTLNKIDPYAVKPKGFQALTTPPKTMSFSEFDSFINTYDYQKVYELAKESDEMIGVVKSEAARLRADNEALKKWLKLDVSPDEFDKLRQVKTIIGSVSKLAADQFRLKAEAEYKHVYIEFIGELKEDVTMLILVPVTEYDEAFAYFKTLGFAKLTLPFKGIPAQQIIDNNKELERLQQVREEAYKRLEGLGGEYENLNIAVDYFETVLEREKACENFLKMETVVYLEGWVPEESAADFKQLVAGVCGQDCYIEEEAVEKDSTEVPIKLKNNKVVSAFEDVTRMFSMPLYNEIDPTAALMPFYIVFFGFMVGDAGYGLLLLIASWFAKEKLYLSPGMKNFMNFFYYLSFGVIFAGFIYGSFFGFGFFRVATNVNTGEAKAILDTNADVLQMLILSVVMGGVQIFTGLFIKGYMLIRDGRPLEALCDAGFWVIAVSFGIAWILVAAGVIPAQYNNIIKWVFILSLLGLAATQGRGAATPVGKVASGIYEVYNLSGYVGDLVSYTRIAALALSGAYIAYSFNIMAELLTQNIIGWIFAAVVFILGAALNIGLSLLGAYVHTCRLQYVEYFGKFYNGGGIPFTAFSLKNKFTNIK